MMPPGYVAMPPPGSMQGQPVFAPQQPSFNQPPRQQYAQAPQQRPVIRGAAPEEKTPVHQEPPASLPAPDKLGITPRQTPVDPTAVDWNATHAYVKAIGALSFSTERPSEGGYRCNLVMPTAESGRTYHLVGDGATEADAVRVCLDKTYRWLKQLP